MAGTGQSEFLLGPCKQLLAPRFEHSHGAQASDIKLGPCVSPERSTQNHPEKKSARSGFVPLGIERMILVASGRNLGKVS